MMKKGLSIFVIVSMVFSGLIVGQLLISMPVVAPGTNLPDLTISEGNISINPGTPTVGEPVIINATIWNIGNADATNIEVNFYEEDTLIDSEIIDLPVNKTWTNHTVDSEFNVGTETSIAVDSLNGIHICYRDSSNNELKYAYKPSMGSWVISTVDSGFNVKSPSIAVDGEDGVHISYHDNSADELKYAYKPSGGSWIFETVDSPPGDPGAYTSIAVDGSNGVHISYVDTFIYDLMYAYKPSGGSWTNYLIETGIFAMLTSIAVDGSNGVHISYYVDSPDDDLKYAHKPSGGSWTTYTLDSTGDVGGYSSIVADDSNGIHISYADITNDDLKYAYKPSGGSWSNQTVDSVGYVGDDTSIAVDGENGIHISYFDNGNSDLKYAYKPNGSNWTYYTVDSIGYVGRETSIAIDGTGNIHISYHDSTNIDLKYANLYTPPGNIQTSKSWIPTTSGLRNITVKIDEDNKIQELDETNNNATVSVTVEPGPLTTIEITPVSATLELSETQQFTAMGYDDFNNDVSISPTWEVSGGGTLDQSGLFSANYPGKWTVYANQSDISGIATVTVLVNGTSDIDADGMLDWWEIEYDLDPFDGTDAGLDLDLDSLTNLQEFFNYSNPNNNETDGDSLGDGFEVIFSKTNASNWDTNGNGIGDGLEFIQSQGYLGWIGSLPNDWIGMTISWENYTIYVKTNSSVLEGEFDKEEQKLKIKVSGPEGTQGVTELDIPKGLCNPDDIEIELDGELINYTLTEDDYYYYIYIEYNHSVHVLSASFLHTAEIPGPFVEPDPHVETDEKGLLDELPLLGLIVAIIVIILLLILITRINNEKDDIGMQELPPEKLALLLEQKHEDGEMTDETYEDIKSLLEKYNGG